MQEAVARSLRTAERFLISPPLAATFGFASVAVCDISLSGVRFRHEQRLQTGEKSNLRVSLNGKPRPISLETTIVWTHPDTSAAGGFVSGARTYAPADVVTNLLHELHSAKRTNRIEELRSSDRFYVNPPLDACFGQSLVRVEDLSVRGARIETRTLREKGETEILSFLLPESDVEVAVTGTVVWGAIKALGDNEPLYRAGLSIAEKPELLRLAIGQLCEIDRATLDTHSLRLKLRILRARARQRASLLTDAETSGIPPEQYLLIEGVREELRLNPEEAMHWYRRARLSINDAETRTMCGVIADHPDAIAVWEYLERSIDPSIVGRAFEVSS